MQPNLKGNIVQPYSGARKCIVLAEVEADNTGKKGNL